MRASVRTVFEIVVSVSKKIQIRHGDITEEDVDAIVNAANGRLSHGGGVAGAIARKAGDALDDESRKWISSNGPVDTGQVAVTGAGRLPYNYVIHAVGPIWQGGSHGEARLLESAFFNSLIKAQELGQKSIAIPAISSGIFGFPKDLCAEISIKTATRFYREHPDSSIHLIRFTNIDFGTVSVFHHAARAFGRSGAAEED